ncbi:MAG: 2-succinyl-5-enolpyruvyl-6-hydroxy-3-cyclohexene-1-carboxylic-acid synthase [Myxococcota bacterium]
MFDNPANSSDPIHPSLSWGRLVVEELVRLGCTRVYAAPGSRSAPLTLAAAGHGGVTLTMGYDERSLGFCALGWGRAVGMQSPLGELAAVIVTSGTAVANLFPAVVEASHDHVPLLLLTADRPDHLRHSGANQTINQLDLFGRFVRWHASLPTPNGDMPRQFVIATAREAVLRALGPDPGPVHLNMPLARLGGISYRPCANEEADQNVVKSRDAINRVSANPNEAPPFFCHSRPPLSFLRKQESIWTPAKAGVTNEGEMLESTAEPPQSKTAATASFSELQSVIDVLRRARQGLVIVAGGYRDDDDGAALDRLLTRLGWPVFAEGLCAARYRTHSCIVPSFDLLLGCSHIATRFCPDVVLQLGTRVVSPTLDRWLQRRAAGEDGEQTARLPYIMAGEHPGTVDPHFAVTHRLPLRGFVPSVLASFCHSHPPCHFDEPPSCHTGKTLSCHPDERSEEGSPHVPTGVDSRLRGLPKRSALRCSKEKLAERTKMDPCFRRDDRVGGPAESHTPSLSFLRKQESMKKSEKRDVADFLEGPLRGNDKEKTLNRHVIRDGLLSFLPHLSRQTQRIIDETLATQDRLTEPFVARCISRVVSVVAAGRSSSPAGFGGKGAPAKYLREAQNFVGQKGAQPQPILFLGNSMPVRDMGRFAVATEHRGSPFTVVTTNRGASGIDGVLSTACGVAHGSDSPVTLVVGDLSFLHDCNGLALLRETPQPVTVVVINNRGGGIFALLPFARESGVFERCFQTRHDHDLGSLCRGFGVPHTAVEHPAEFAQAYAAALQRGKTSVIEARTDVEHDMALRRHIERAIDRMVKKQPEE